MKKLIYGVIALLIGLGIAEGCKKVDGLATQEILATKTTITAGYLDSLTVSNTTATDSIVWTITPVGANMYHHTNYAFVSFSKAGTYTVTAVVNGGTPLTLTITVNAAPTPPADPTPPQTTHVPLTNDQISLTASFHAGPVANPIRASYR